jgi:hypothetical protein
LKKGLVPTALIVYRREPYIDACHSDIRLTIDSDLRGQFKPDLGDLVHDSDLKPVIKDLAILELKFDDFMPGWMGALLKKFKFRRESISKYCLGIQSCCETLLEKDKE